MIGFALLVLATSTAEASACEEIRILTDAGLSAQRILESLPNRGEGLPSDELRCIQAIPAAPELIDPLCEQRADPSDPSGCEDVVRRALEQERRDALDAETLRALQLQYLHDVADAAPQNWTVEASTDPMLDTATLVARTAALQETRTRFGHVVRAELVARCRRNELEVYVATGVPADPEAGRYSSATVMVRAGTEPARSVVATEATDLNGLFLPGPAEWLGAMSRTDRFLFEYTPFLSSPHLLEFDTSGFAQVADALRLVCSQPQWLPPGNAD